MDAFYIFIDCNYPEASKYNTIFLSNITAESSQTRIVNDGSGLLNYAGPANVTVQNTKIGIYASLSDQESQIEIVLSPTCLPDDSVPQLFTLK